MIQRPHWNLTIFKVHFGLLTLKAYTKCERVLRFEAIVHNTRTWVGPEEAQGLTLGPVSTDGNAVGVVRGLPLTAGDVSVCSNQIRSSGRA